MKNFIAWLHKRNPEYLIESNVKSYYLEQLGAVTKATLERLNARDRVLIQKLEKTYGIEIKVEDIYCKITNITPKEILLATRQNPKKFQFDYEQLEKGNVNDERDLLKMTMGKREMNNSIQIIVFSAQGAKKLFTNNTLAMTATLSPEESYILMPINAFSKPPTQQNPLGELTAQGLNTLAHEAGHSSQIKLYTPQARTTNDYDYVNLPSELGTRLAIVKNANTQKNFIDAAKQLGFENYINIISLLADNRLQNQRFYVIISSFLDKDEGISAFNQMAQIKEIKDALNNIRMDSETFYKTVLIKVIDKFIDIVEINNIDVNQFFGFLQATKKRYPNNVEQLKQRLIYAYPKVALGEKPTNMQQSGDDIQTA